MWTVETLRAADDLWEALAVPSSTESNHPRNRDELAPQGMGGQELPLAHIAASAILVLGALDLGLEQAIVIPALPTIARQEGATPDQVTWLVTGFLLASAVALPLAARLGDIYGRRRILLGSLALFAAGSAVCALGGSLAALVAGRIVQGAGAAVAVVAAGVIRDHIPAERVPAAVGLLIAAAGAGYAVGLALGGLLADRASVSAIFWSLFAIALALFLLAWFVVPRSGARGTGGLDWAGAALLGAGAAILLLGISKGNDWGWRSPAAVLAIAGGVLILVTFVLVELRAAVPVVDVRAMGERPLAAANASAFAVGFGLFIASVVIPQLASLPAATGYGLGLTAAETGLVLVPGALAMLIFGLLGGRLSTRLGARTLVAAGAACAVVSYVLMGLWHDTAGQLAAENALLGMGIGLSIAAIANLVVASVEPARTSGSLGLNALLRVIGSALGAQIAAALITGPGLIPQESGFSDAFALGAAAAASAAIVAGVLPSRAGDPVVRRPAPDPA